MSDLISRQAAIDKVNEYASIWMEYTEGMSKDEIAQAALNSAKQTMIRILSELPSAQPDEEKISDSLYEVYRLTCSQLGTGGVSVLKYYIAEIWREIYGEEGPKWLKK